jgi:hypothetical protein
MSTSGITINQMTRDSIINAALRKTGALSEGQVANTTQLGTGAEALNNLVSEFQALGMPLWARRSLAIPMVVGQSSYTIGVGQATNVPFPLRVYQATIDDSSNGNQIIMMQKPLYDFVQYPASSTGTPVVFNYTPQINKGVMQIWPTPNTSIPTGLAVTLQYQTPFEIFNASTDTPDFPQEWNNAVIYQLASILAPEYVLPLPTMQMLEKQAAIHLENALSNGVEDGSIFFQIDSIGR